MKKKIIISAVVVCAALIGLAFASGPMGGWPRDMEEKVAYVTYRIAEKLELDESQKDVLDRIAKNIVAEHKEISGDREAFKTDLMETLGKEQVSPEELKALFETRKPVIDDVMQLASRHIAEFHSILTPEQRATLISEIEAHQGRRCRFWR